MTECAPQSAEPQAGTHLGALPPLASDGHVTFESGAMLVHDREGSDASALARSGHRAVVAEAAAAELHLRARERRPFARADGGHASVPVPGRNDPTIAASTAAASTLPAELTEVASPKWLHAARAQASSLASDGAAAQEPVAPGSLVPGAPSRPCCTEHTQKLPVPC